MELEHGEGTRMVSTNITNTTGNSGANTNTQSANTSADSLPFPNFIWGAGVECSFLPHLKVDQYEWTQHEKFWREDLNLESEELGISNLRYALPCPKIETD